MYPRGRMSRIYTLSLVSRFLQPPFALELLPTRQQASVFLTLTPPPRFGKITSQGRSLSFASARRASELTDGEGEIGICCICDRPWPAQRPVHSRASRLQPFDPDGSQHTLKCSPAALDPRYSCWQCCCGAPYHAAVLRVSVLCLPCAYLQAHRTRVQPLTTTQTQLPPRCPSTMPVSARRPRCCSRCARWLQRSRPALAVQGWCSRPLFLPGLRAALVPLPPALRAFRLPCPWWLPTSLRWWTT